MKASGSKFHGLSYALCCRYPALRPDAAGLRSAARYGSGEPPLSLCCGQTIHWVVWPLLRSRRRPRAKRATGAFRRLAASRSGSLQYRPTSFRSRCSLQFSRCLRITATRSTSRVAVRGDCKMYEAHHMPNSWHACCFDLALRGLLATCDSLAVNRFAALVFSGLRWACCQSTPQTRHPLNLCVSNSGGAGHEPPGARRLRA